jgi:hypothetical protein
VRDVLTDEGSHRSSSSTGNDGWAIQASGASKWALPKNYGEGSRAAARWLRGQATGSQPFEINLRTQREARRCGSANYRNRTTCALRSVPEATAAQQEGYVRRLTTYVHRGKSNSPD